MLPRPRFRLPLWGAAVIIVVAYVVRSVGRGFDFRPDLPSDLIALLLIVVVLAAVAYMRHRPEDADEAADATRDDEKPGP